MSRFGSSALLSESAASECNFLVIVQRHIAEYAEEQNREIASLASLEAEAEGPKGL